MFCWKAVRGNRQQATGWPPLITLTGGRSHWCGTSADGAAYCWGDASAGKLGSPDTLPADRARPVAGGLAFQTVSGGLEHTCGVTTEGRIFCWGRNNAGQLGTVSVPYSATPVEVVLPR